MSNEQSVKCATNTPPGVGADSSRPYPNIINYVHSRHQIRVSVSPHTHFPSPLRVCSRICGHDKSDPYACERIAIMLLTVCNNAANKLQYTHVHPQTPYFRTTKTILLQRKNHTFAPQKPIGDKLGGSQKRFVKIIIVAETNISHTQNKTLSSLLEYHFLNHYNRLYRVRITI